MSYVHHVQRSDGSHKLAWAMYLSQGWGDASKIRKKNTCTHKQAHEPKCLGAENTDWKGGWWLNVSCLNLPAFTYAKGVTVEPWSGGLRLCWSLTVLVLFSVLPKSGRVLKLLWVKAPTVVSRLRVTWSTEFPFYFQNQIHGSRKDLHNTTTSTGLQNGLI